MNFPAGASCRPVRLLLLSGVVGLALAVRASGQSIIESFIGFSSPGGLTFNGSTQTTTTSDGVVLRLVPAATGQAGSAFTSTPVAANGFSTAFNFRLTNPGGITDAASLVGADGFTFTLQSVSANSLGASGGSLGYEGINHSVSVQFDTFQNSGDPSSNFLALHSTNNNGNSSTLATHSVAVANFDNGNLWTAWVDYNGTTLEVRVSNTGTRPTTADISQTINLTSSSILNGSTAFAGFTAGTGSAYENQYIVNWAYSSTFVIGGISPTMAIPEPSTYVLLALGLGAMLAGRRWTRRAR